MNSTNGTLPLMGIIPFASINVIFIVIALLIILFNGIVLFIMRKDKNLQNAQNGLLASLAISDLSSGLVGTPLMFACSFAPYYLSCALCSVSYYFFKFISISTVLHIMAIIGERCFTVVNPFLHRRLRATPGRSNLIIIGSIWLTSLVTSCIPWIWVSEEVKDCLYANWPQETWNPDSIYELTCFLVFFILPLVFISIFLAKIFIAVHQFTRRRSQRCVDDVKEQIRLRKTEMRIFLVLFTVFVLFVVCWLPYFAVALMDVINVELPDWLHTCVPFFRSITSLLNPVVYAFYKDDFYQSMKRKLRSLRNRWKEKDSDFFTSKQKVQLPLVGLDPLATTV